MNERAASHLDVTIIFEQPADRMLACVAGDALHHHRGVWLPQPPTSATTAAIPVAIAVAIPVAVAVSVPEVPAPISIISVTAVPVAAAGATAPPPAALLAVGAVEVVEVAEHCGSARKKTASWHCVVARCAPLGFVAREEQKQFGFAVVLSFCRKSRAAISYIHIGVRCLTQTPDPGQIQTPKTLSQTAKSGVAREG